MRIDVYLPLLLSLLLFAASGRAGRRVAPASAARVLTAAGVLTAAATTWALILPAATLADHAPPVVADAHADGWRLPEPVPEAIAMAAVAALVVIAWCLRRTIRTDAPPAGPAPPVRGPSGRRRTPRHGFCDSAGVHHPGHAGPDPGHLRDARGAATRRAPGVARPRTRPPRPPPRPARPRRHPRCRGQPFAHAGANDGHLPGGALGRRVCRRGGRRSRHHCARLGSCRSRGLSARLRNFSDRAVLRRIAALQSAPPPPHRPIAASVLALGVFSAFGAAGATGDLRHLLGQALT